MKRKNEDGHASTKGVKTDDMGRQVWDKTVYLQKAAARAMGIEEDEANEKPDPKRRKLLAGETPKEYLQARNGELNLERRIGERKAVEATETRRGFTCDLCNCVLTDSQSYLDHINGKKHNAARGMTMRVAKVDRKGVADRIQRAKEKREKLAASKASKDTPEQHHHHEDDDEQPPADDEEKRLAEHSTEEKPPAVEQEPSVADETHSSNETQRSAEAQRAEDEVQHPDS